MKFNMIFKKVKEFIMKNFLQVLSAFIILIIIILIHGCFGTEAVEMIDYEAEILKCEQEISFYTTMKTNAHQMAESARALGYTDNHMIIIYAKRDWENAQSKLVEATTRKNTLIAERDNKWNQRSVKYPTATTIWRYLSDYGFNDHVIAGIVGNMMAETGGHTLNIETRIWDGSGGYYGICQWSLKYNPQLSGVDLTAQLEHLVSSMEYEFNTFGKNYKSGFGYTDFLQLTDSKEAALAFAKCYERCAGSTYSKRQKNAIKAYEYFTS